MVNNPNSLLLSRDRRATKSATTTLQCNHRRQTGSGQRIRQYGLAGYVPNAEAESVTSTFWLETIQGESAPSQLQYSQIVLLKFGDLSRLMSSVGTLRKAGLHSRPLFRHRTTSQDSPH